MDGRPWETFDRTGALIYALSIVALMCGFLPAGGRAGLLMLAGCCGLAVLRGGDARGYACSKCGFFPPRVFAFRAWPRSSTTVPLSGSPS
jgi:hypothetical protein